MAIGLFILYLVFTLIVLYHKVNPVVWEVGSVAYLLVSTFFIGLTWATGLLVWLIIPAIMAIIRAPTVQARIADFIFVRAAKSIPKLSETEEIALNAGDTWLEKDIFMGQPDWGKLASVTSQLTQEEQAFLDNETHMLCSMLDDWTISQEGDLPPKVWNYIKEQGFLGLVIAKEYGGKGFSARAHSEVVMKIATRSASTAVTVMVPNSLGPGELLQHYGTEEQKSFYLSRLAKGEDIPCFALTEPEAGSDATSIQSEAVVTMMEVDGSPALGLTIQLNKRWITLAPVATLIGLAVNVKDPHHLLNGTGKEGITCVLISRDTENLEIGNRHWPAEQAFMNGTVRGSNLVVPMNAIVGGQKMAGHGWQMLVECLSIGRSISLPALSSGSSSLLYLATSAFVRIRRQFNLEIGQFEGVEEKLAEIGGLTYLINATRLLTAAAVDAHIKPSVASAITKYYNTELARVVINHAMDIHAGRAIMAGPRNYLANYYATAPISITVEGANIMSRNLLIFGQGSMACHPYICQEFYAIKQQDKEAFRPLLWSHIGYFLRNAAKTIVSAWTGGWFISAPVNDLQREYQRLARLSYCFAWVADLSLMHLGSQLKRKERLSARLADAMSYLYLAMAALRYYQHHSDHEAHRVHAKWATTYCFHHTEKALLGWCENFPSRAIGFLVRVLAFPWGRTMRYPSDTLDHDLAKGMMTNNVYRQQLKEAVYLSGEPNQPVDRMEKAMQLIIQHESLYHKMKELSRCNSGSIQEKLQEKYRNGELTEHEMSSLLELEKARWDAIQVDEFPFESLKRETSSARSDTIKSPFETEVIGKARLDTD